MFSKPIQTLCLLLLGFAAGTAYAGKPAALTKQESKSIQALIDSAPENGQPALMDLSDPAHDQAYRAILRINGLTPANRPQLFNSLAQVKKSHQALRAKGKPRPVFSSRRSAFAASDAPNDDYAVLNIGTNDWGVIDATAFSTMFRGSHYSNTAVTVTDNTGDVIKSNVGEEWDGGKDMAVDSGDGRNTTGGDIDVLGVYYGEDNAGKPYGPVYAAIAGGYYPKQIQNNKPVITTTNNHIVICLNRANPDPSAPTACDYGPTDPGKMPPDIKFPFKGSVQYFGNIKVDPNTGKPPRGSYSVSLSLTGRTTGGNCKLVEIGESFMNDPNTKINGDTITWDLEPANFGTVCWQNNEYYTLTLALMLTIDKTPVWATITNAPNTKPTVSTLVTSDLQLQYGCIIEGTPILMADGTTKTVETIQRGDRLRGRDGKPVIVEWRTNGWDNQSVVLTDSAGRSLQVTPLHPVATERGMVQARDLKIGDSIFGPEGKSKLTSITVKQSPKAFNVYNLGVVDAQGAFIAQRDHAAFFAGSLLVGDAAVQTELSRKMLQGAQATNASELRRRVRPAWRADFDNWAKEQSVRVKP